MGAHRFERDAGRRTVGFAVFAAMCCLVWGLPAAAQASSSPSEVQTEPAQPIPGGAKLKGKLNPDGLPTTYYFVYARDTCDEGCTPSKTAKSGPLTGDTTQEVPAVEVTGLSGSGGSERYWYILVATNADGTVYGGLVDFTPGAPLPSISGESVSRRTQTDATLEAQINPQGDQAGDYYQFQLVSHPSEYASEILCPTKPPPATDGCGGTHSESALPIGWVCGGCERLAPQFVQLDLASVGVTLKPATTYHYRVIAARAIQTEDTIQWEPPPVYGPDQTFTTPPAGKLPSIESVSVSHLTSTDATLEAQLNTQALETTYQFRLESGCLWPQACPEITVYPLPSGNLLGSFAGQSVSLDLNSAGVTLMPGIEYAYRFVAQNGAGKGESSEHRFTTPEDGVQPLNTTTPSGPHSIAGLAQTAGQGTVTPATTNPLGKITPSLKMTILTNAQKLSKAVEACKRKPKRQRATCIKQAHKRYGPAANKKGKGKKK
ncbi:MAG TPA: hypothetical protein VGX26_11435 [Solirubrobacteraceae bacterium]|jgi:hypothetical protein|nr:hypothetical protein [Solirubrobacteraceae bacterium]